MDMRIPRIKLKMMLESNPLKSRTLVRRLAVDCRGIVKQPGHRGPQPVEAVQSALTPGALLLLCCYYIVYDYC